MLPIVELPNDARLRWILSSAAQLIEAGTEPVSGLVLPNARFFPDVFDGTPKTIEQLLGRIVHHAGLDDIEFRLAVVSPEGETTGGGGCNSGGCSSGGSSATQLRRVAPAADDDSAWIISVAAQEIGNPTVLTTALVRGVSYVFLREAELLAQIEPEQVEATVDMTGVFLGFGVLLANGSYIYAKSCGGVKVQSATRLPVEEITLALAVCCKLHNHQTRAARKDLDPTPKAMFDEASTWADANAGVVRLLRTDRAAIEAESYALSEARGWFSRLFGLGRAKGPSVPTDEELEAMVSEQAAGSARPVDPEKAKRLAAIRELVDESFDAG